MKHGRWLRSTVCLAALAMMGNARADAAAQKVLDCMRANVPISLQIKEVELKSIDRAGAERVLTGKVYASRIDGLVRVLLLISRPRDLDGAAYLLREGATGAKDDIFLFLPAIQRVRRITGASADGSLLGTDFSYNDMKQLQNAFGDAVATLDKPTMIEQRLVQVLNLAPLAGAPARYSRVRAYVDDKACVALKVEFLEGNAVRKELTAPVAGLQRSEGYWYLSDILMRDLKDKTSTRLKVVGVASGDKDLPSRLFDPTSFYRAH